MSILPAVSGPESPVEPPQTLLVVDDEPQLLRLLTRIFERRGAVVLAAKDGDEALELFTAHLDEIDVVLLDVVIPPDGVTALLSRMLELREHVGVVLTSGDELPAALGEQLEALGGVFLRKPFSPDSAQAALRRVAAESRRRAGATTSGSVA
jgi:DNA-binding NtrC family response regulator